MPNRFTDDLLCTGRDLLVTAIYDILHVQHASCTFFAYWWEATDYANEYTKISDTMICLLAAMSDEDIDELVINWKE